MSNVSNLEYQNANTLRRYPIREGLDVLSTDGSFRLPDEFVVDFQIAASSDITQRFYISRVVNTATTITVEISDKDAVYAGLFTIPVATHQLYNSYFLTPSATFTGANGVLVVGVLTAIQAQPIGSFTFTIDQTEFETRTVLPAVTAVNRIIFTDKSGVEHSLTGDVVLNAESNMRFRYTGADTIFLDAGEGLGLNLACDPATSYIKTINGQTPDVNGAFTLSGGDCLTITTQTNGLVFVDDCCKPCVGCDDLTLLTERLVQIESDLLKIRDQFTALSVTVDKATAVVQNQCTC